MLPEATTFLISFELQPTCFFAAKMLMKFLSNSSYPIGSMYAIYGNIYHQYSPNVSIYTIHGSYGYGWTKTMNIFNQWNSDDGYFPMVAWSCCSPHKTSHAQYIEIRQVVDFPVGKCKLISKSRGWNWVPSRNVKDIFQIISANIQTSKSPGLSYVCLISLLGEHYTAVANPLASSLIWSQWAQDGSSTCHGAWVHWRQPFVHFARLHVCFISA